MSVNYSDLAITSLETITAFDVTTGAFMWVLDELQSATISHSEDTTDITGKQGRLLNTLKRNKAVTVSGNNGLISGGLLATQVGSEFEEKTTTVMWPDYIVVTGNSATTTYKAVGTAGNEIGTVYVHNDDGSLGKSFTQNATADATGNFAYAPETKELTFFEGDIEDGTKSLCITSARFRVRWLRTTPMSMARRHPCTSMLLLRTAATMCIGSSSTSLPPISTVLSMWRWARTRLSMPSRLVLWQALAVRAVCSGPTPCLVRTPPTNPDRR